jgi:hypothetical protein
VISHKVSALIIYPQPGQAISEDQRAVIVAGVALENAARLFAAHALGNQAGERNAQQFLDAQAGLRVRALEFARVVNLIQGEN